jgi:hypothetical protein
MEKKEITTRFDFIDNDKRIIDQKLRRHDISQPEYQKILKNAPDEKEVSDDLLVFKESVSE